MEMPEAGGAALDASTHDRKLHGGLMERMAVVFGHALNLHNQRLEGNLM